MVNNNFDEVVDVPEDDEMQEDYFDGGNDNELVIDKFFVSEDKVYFLFEDGGWKFLTCDDILSIADEVNNAKKQ